MKRLSVLSAVIVFAAAACGGSSVPPTGAPAAPPTPASASAGAGSSPAASGPVTITYLVGIAEDPEIDQQAEAMIQEFNDTHPNIQVKREALDNDQLRTIIQTRLGSGDVASAFVPCTPAGSMILIRQILGDDARGPRIIKTVHGEGYVIGVPVERG